MNKLIPVILGVAILGGSAVMADEPVTKNAKAPAAVKKVIKAKKEKAAKKAAKGAAAAVSKAPASETKAPVTETKK